MTTNKNDNLIREIRENFLESHPDYDVYKTSVLSDNNLKTLVSIQENKFKEMQRTSYTTNFSKIDVCNNFEDYLYQKANDNNTLIESEILLEIKYLTLKGRMMHCDFFRSDDIVDELIEDNRPEIMNIVDMYKNDISVPDEGLLQEIIRISVRNCLKYYSDSPLTAIQLHLKDELISEFKFICE